jgi:hypothetical protein
VIASEHEAVSGAAHVQEFLDAQPNIAGIINRERQFVLVNEQLLEMLGLSDVEDILGRRLGEALKCVHSKDFKGGCETSESCRYCGAVQAIVECQRTGSKVSNECRITCFSDDGPEAMDLLVTASPCVLNNYEYVILAVSDIGAQKRRSALERVFFHDVINTATTLHLLIEELEDGYSDATQELPVLKRLRGPCWTMSSPRGTLARRSAESCAWWWHRWTRWRSSRTWCCS